MYIIGIYKWNYNNVYENRSIIYDKRKLYDKNSEL